MKKVFFVTLLLSCSFLLAQDSYPASGSQQESKDSKGQITVQGCVSQFSGDYTLVKQNPAMTYELQATGKTKLRHYLGKRVEVSGNQAPTLSTSSDASSRVGSPAPVTITVTSIRIIDKSCSEQDVSR